MSDLPVPPDTRETEDVTLRMSAHLRGERPPVMSDNLSMLCPVCGGSVRALTKQNDDGSDEPGWRCDPCGFWASQRWLDEVGVDEARRIHDPSLTIAEKARRS
jgi:uncharacterized protein with PIN domain